MKKKIISCLLAITMMAAWTPPVFASEEGPAVAVWVSKVNASDSGMEKGLEQQTPLQFRMDDGVNISNLITVEENNTYQTMDGFGASITEASAHLYQTELSNQQQISMMTALFDKETGIGLSMLRQPIGATDHCVAPYTFASSEQADSLPGFDFSHELKEIFPTVEDALAVEPGRVKVMASCWSPPGWMKQNGSELGITMSRERSKRRNTKPTPTTSLSSFRIMRAAASTSTPSLLITSQTTQAMTGQLYPCPIHRPKRW